MEKQNRKVDEFFREALQHHAVVPTEAAKAAFLKEAATLNKIGKPGRKIYYYLSGIILLLLICTGIYFLQPGFSVNKVQNMTKHSSSIVKIKSQVTEQKTNADETPIPMIASLPNSKQHSTYIPIKHPFPNHSSISRNPDKQNKTEESSTSVELPSSSLSSQSSSGVPAQNPSLNAASAIQENPVKHQSPEQLTPNQKPAVQAASDSTAAASTNTEIIPTQDLAQKAKEKEKNTRSGNSKNLNLDLGAYYSPEWMFNTLEGEKYVNNFGIEGTFHFGKYSIRTGAGLSITKGTNELSVSYNDYQGSYNKLDSISFVWDAYRTHLIPTYHYTKTSVWDSVIKIHYAKIIKRYTYLQVPLILGYDFWKNDRFSVGIRVGPILSVLLETKQVSDNYDPGKNRIIQINLITPERIQTYWQFMGGVNASFNISRRFGFEIEPDFRYYFNSVYEKSGINKKPWSMGFRAAFEIKN